MRILVTGTAGQVARSLRQQAARFPALELTFAGRPEFDLGDPAGVSRAIAEAAPDLVINAAAYTAVDAAEAEEAAALAINRDGAAAVAAGAAEAGARMIQLSTDYVFSGEGTGPWREDAALGPINAYARSKLAGEEAVRAACPAATIVRTAWVYSPFGTNFVRTMVRLAAERDEIRVVEDQRGNPTSALDLADALLSVAESWRGGGSAGLGETYHVAAAGTATWAEFANAIMAELRALGQRSAAIVPIAGADWPTPAARPADSRLDCTKFARDFGLMLPPWRDSLGAVVRQLVEAR